MNETLIGALAALGGACIGGLFSYLSAKTGQAWSDIRHDVRGVAEQTAAYHKLEDRMATRIAELEGDCSAKTIKTRFRDMVAEEGGVRPEMTEKQAAAIQKKWRL